MADKYKTLEGNSLYGTTTHEMDQLRISGLRLDSQDKHEKGMYQEAAKKVVFWNCMSHCEISQKDVPNFNGKFYYTQHKEQNCLQTCYNAKMLLHFGETTCKEDNLYLDFAKMKEQYKAMEHWNPKYKHVKKYVSGWEEDKINSVTEQLLNKTKNLNQSRYWAPLYI